MKLKQMIRMAICLVLLCSFTAVAFADTNTFTPAEAGKLNLSLDAWYSDDAHAAKLFSILLTDSGLAERFASGGDVNNVYIAKYSMNGSDGLTLVTAIGNDMVVLNYIPPVNMATWQVASYPGQINETVLTAMFSSAPYTANKKLPAEMIKAELGGI